MQRPDVEVSDGKKERRQEADPPETDQQSSPNEASEHKDATADVNPKALQTSDEAAASEATAEGREARSQKATMHTSIEELDADTVNIAEKQEFNKNEYRQFFLGSEEIVSIKPFSIHHTISISEERERELAEMHVFDEENTDHFLSILHHKRLLMISGEPDIGKGTTALYLGHQLGQKEVVSKETYMVPSLDRNVKIDLRELSDQIEDFGGRLIIFKDTFARGNRDLMEFFVRLDQHILEAISNKLRESQAFFIFTADTLTLAPCQAQLSRLNLQEQLRPLTDELLMRGLSLNLDRFAAAKDEETAKEIERLLGPEEQQSVIKVLRTMPQVVRFVDNYLIEVIEGRLDLNQAVHRSDNLGEWFQRDLSDNFDVWCFALTLCLSQCLPYSPGIPWFEFEYLWNNISKCLKLKFELPEQKEEIPLKNILSEDFFLQRCCAKIHRDLSAGEDMVRFNDDRYPEMLWDVLLTSNRRTLSAILPTLIEMAQEADPHIRATAARIIGRIGEIDPSRITFAIMNKWMQSNRHWLQATVGYLYQGIIASHDQQYRDKCLNVLKTLAESEGKAELWTAIAAYKQIGVYDPQLAISQLGQIADRKFSRTIEDTQRIDKILERIENIFRDKSLNEIEIMGLDLYHEFLREISQRIFAQEGGILFALQYAIVSLCLAVDPIQVFEELQKWMETDKKSLSALVALIFLQEDGIAEILENQYVELSRIGTDDLSEAQRCNPIVVSLTSNDSAVHQMATFLTSVFESFSTFFPVKSRRYLRKSFLMHLKSWVKAAQPIERCRSVMEQLFVELLHSRSKTLSDKIYDFLNHDPDFAYEGSELFLFANGVMERSLNTPAHRLI